MTDAGRTIPRVFSIPAGAPFLPTLAEAVLAGRLVPEFAWDRDPLTLADTTVYVPTRRAARELRSAFLEALGGRSAILPAIRPLGETDEDAIAFEPDGLNSAGLAPPIAPMERLLRLAPLVLAWKARLPPHIAGMFDEPVAVPTSTADAIWLARDLAALIDEVETEGSDWSRLATLVDAELAGWWQVTLEFLDIATRYWPQELAGLGLSNPAAHRNAQLRQEAQRLQRQRPRGPVVAAGSTGSIPATAELLKVISRLPNGAVVLPGLDLDLDARSWQVLRQEPRHPSVCGHPQYGLAGLIESIGVQRSDIVAVGDVPDRLALRARIVGEATRPAETTDEWLTSRGGFSQQDLDLALQGVTLLEAANQREEATAIAIALRCAVAEKGATAALATADRELARRVSAELLRFGIRADDSGGTPLLRTAPAELARLLLATVFGPPDPVALAGLIKHPFLRLGLDRSLVRRAAEIIELVMLRDGTARPDVESLEAFFERRLKVHMGRRPFWLDRLGLRELGEARSVLSRFVEALRPLVSHRGRSGTVAALARSTAEALEACCRDGEGGTGELYEHDAGEAFAGFLRSLVESGADLSMHSSEWPEAVTALMAGAIVKPSAGPSGRVFIWGTLEARLQRVDMLVLGGLNEGSWPRRADAGRFMSRLMKGRLEIEPPERRIGLAAHDFTMALGHERIVLSRAARSAEGPTTPTRWLQRLAAFVGEEATRRMRERGTRLVEWARQLDDGPPLPPLARPEPKPPTAARPKRLSVTEIETLRRDPYAVYARRVLHLSPLRPLLGDPGAAERGTLVHSILKEFTAAVPDPTAPGMDAILARIIDAALEESELSDEVRALWRPRLLGTIPELLDFERTSRGGVVQRLAEQEAQPQAIGGTGVELTCRADRIDLNADGTADILDYKTGSTPTVKQAKALLAPQLALEGALLMRGAFPQLGARIPRDLLYVRLRSNGEVKPDSIIGDGDAAALSEDAWRRLEQLVRAYQDPGKPYASRALPLRRGEREGDYDHLARVLEWSAGGEEEEPAELE